MSGRVVTKPGGPTYYKHKGLYQALYYIGQSKPNPTGHTTPVFSTIAPEGVMKSLKESIARMMPASKADATDALPPSITESGKVRKLREEAEMEGYQGGVFHEAGVGETGDRMPLSEETADKLREEMERKDMTAMNEANDARCREEGIPTFHEWLNQPDIVKEGEEYGKMAEQSDEVISPAGQIVKKSWAQRFKDAMARKNKEDK